MEIEIEIEFVAVNGFVSHVLSKEIQRNDAIFKRWLESNFQLRVFHLIEWSALKWNAKMC